MDGNDTDPQNNTGEFVSLVAPSPQESTPVPQTTEPLVADTTPKKKRSKLLIVLLPVIAVLSILTVGGVFAYRAYFESPERIFATMLENMQEVKTYGYEGDLMFSLRFDESGGVTGIFFPTTFGIALKGDMDINDASNPKSTANMDIQANSSTIANGDIVSLGTVSYLRLNSVANLGFGDTSSIDSLKGKWFQLDPDKLNDLYPGMESQVPDASGYQAEYAEVIKILSETNPIAITETLEEEIINGQAMHHYKYVIDKSKLRDSINRLYAYYNEAYEIPKEAGVEEAFNEVLDKLTLIEGEIWIGRKDVLLHRATFNLQFESNSGDEYFNSFSMNIDFTLSNFNEPLTIEAPQEYEDLVEYMQSFTANQFSQARDTQRRSDLYAITNAIYQYAAEHNGNLPGELDFPSEPTCIGTAPECFDLGSSGGLESIVPTYIAAIPFDPMTGTSENTGYLISVDSNGRVAASAIGEETPEIVVTR